MLFLLLLGTLLAHDPAQAQICQGIPLEPGNHEVGVMAEVDSGETLLAARYAGSSRAFAWRAHAGGISDDFPGSFPGDFQPVAGAGAAWIGGFPRSCPTLSLQLTDEDPGGFSVEPGDSDRNRATFVFGWGLGFATTSDSTRPLSASAYVLPQMRWERVTLKFGSDRSVESERYFAFETGVAIAGRRLWTGAGVRFRDPEGTDVVLGGVWLLRGGVRW